MMISQEGIPFPSSKTNAYYSALKAGIDSSPQPAVNVGTTSSTNYTGRLEIIGKHVNLENAKIRGQGVVNIKAETLNSTGLLIDVPFLNYNLGITNSDLLLKNLSQASISRFASGTIQAWSAIWTNAFA